MVRASCIFLFFLTLLAAPDQLHSHSIKLKGTAKAGDFNVYEEHKVAEDVTVTCSSRDWYERINTLEIRAKFRSVQKHADLYSMLLELCRDKVVLKCRSTTYTID